MLEGHVHPPTETVGGDPVRRRLLCKTRPEHERPELDDESDRSWTTTHLEWEANERN